MFIRVFYLTCLVIALASATCPTTRKGHRGECVKAVQRAVGASVDGIFGSGTESKVKSFQTSRGLSADGIVGPDTWAAINGGGSSPVNPPSGGSSSIVRNNCGCGIQEATACTDGPTAGATRLARYLKSKFGGRTEIYNCRTVRGGSTTSLHGEGRAVDFYHTATQMKKVWDEVRAVGCNVGLQRAIYARQIWDASRGIRHYSGQHPHNDHVHIELNKCAASKLTTN